MKVQKIIIIGSGIGGLSAAAILAKQGHKVTVLEKNSHFGGRAGTLEINGFKYDTGPSWWMLLDVWHHWFELMDERVDDYIDVIKLDPSYQIFFNDGSTPIQLHANPQANKQLFESIEPGSYPKYLEYIAKGKQQYELSLSSFLYKNLEWYDYFSPSFLKLGYQMQLYPMISSFIKRYFKSPRLQEILLYNLAFLGSSPYQTSALYSLMNYVDTLGVYYPMHKNQNSGGINVLIETMIRIGKKHGVTYLNNSPVTQINVESKQAKSVTLQNGTSVTADIVISNAHLEFTETKLLEPKYQTYPTRYWSKSNRAPSALLIFAGLNTRIPNALHHNIIFSKDFKQYYDNVFTHPTWPNDPNFYVCCSSVTDPSTAPKGCENISIVIPIAAGLMHTDDFLQTYTDKILETTFKHFGITNWRDHLTHSQSYGVNDFANEFNAPQGTALGLAHTLLQTGPFRPPNKSKRVSNLYYTGADTNPGIGMPMVLISGENTANKIQKDLAKGHV